jgi:hypothetical protein
VDLFMGHLDRFRTILEAHPDEPQDLDPVE